MMGASAGGISYWLADVSFSGFSSTNTGYKLALATDTDDVYINGYTFQTAASRYRGFTLKIDIEGTVQFLNVASGTYVHIERGAVMRGDNTQFYTYGYHDPNNASNLGYWSRYSTSGSFVGDGLYGPFNQNTFYNNAARESAGNNDIMYAVGSNPSSAGIITKFGVNNNNVYGQTSLSVPSSCALYGCFYSSALTSLWFSGRYASGGKNNVVIGRLNSASFSLQQSSTLSNASYTIADAYAITENSSNQIVWAGTQKTMNADNDLSLAILNNTTGAAVATAAFELPTVGPTAALNEASAVVTDSSDNIYVVGQFLNYNLVVGYTIGFVAKFNSSLTLQWCNILYDTTPSSVYFRSIDISSDGSLMVGGSHGDNILAAKLDPEGGGLGTYGPFTYASQSLTPISSIVSVSTGTVALSSVSASPSSASVSSSSASYSSTLYDL